MNPSSEKQHPVWFYICGFNITLVSGLLVTLFGRALGLRRGAALAAAGIGAYTILVGGGTMNRWWKSVPFRANYVTLFVDGWWSVR